jgi:hypothetical protein
MKAGYECDGNGEQYNTALVQSESPVGRRAGASEAKPLGQSYYDKPAGWCKMFDTMIVPMQVMASVFWLVASLAMIIVFVRRRRAGQWKRPRTFPVAMALLGLSAALSATALILRQFGL